MSRDRRGMFEICFMQIRITFGNMTIFKYNKTLILLTGRVHVNLGFHNPPLNLNISRPPHEHHHHHYPSAPPPPPVVICPPTYPTNPAPSGKYGKLKQNHHNYNIV